MTNCKIKMFAKKSEKKSDWYFVKAIFVIDAC